MKVIVVRMMQSKKRHRKGQGLVEYAFIIGFIALLLVAALRLIPQPLVSIFEEAAAALGASPP